MRDDQQRTVGFAQQILEHIDQFLEAPQVDACLRLVEYIQTCAAREHGRDLDALAFAAGQARADLAVDIFLCAQADPGQGRAQRVLVHLLTRGEFHQVAHREALEADRLLEGIGNAVLCTVGHAHFVDHAAVQEDLAAVRLGNAGDEFGKAGLAAAVRAGQHDAFPVGNGQADVIENRFIRHAPANIVEYQHDL